MMVIKTALHVKAGDRIKFIDPDQPESETHSFRWVVRVRTNYAISKYHIEILHRDLDDKHPLRMTTLRYNEVVWIYRSGGLIG